MALIKNSPHFRNISQKKPVHNKHKTLNQCKYIIILGRFDRLPIKLLYSDASCFPVSLNSRI